MTVPYLLREKHGVLKVYSSLFRMTCFFPDGPARALMSWVDMQVSYLFVMTTSAG
ncbi:hypothetical protein BLKGLAD_63610 [Burkholderia gladioli pv. gladioli]